MSQESATYSAWPGGNFSRTYGSVSPQDSTDRPAMSPEIRFRIVTASYVAQTNSVSCVSMMSPQSAAPDPSSGVDQARWFDNEVRPHETSLRSYLKGSFPAMRDIDDVVQETYLRICKTHATQPIQCVRAFLFGIARRFQAGLVDAVLRDGPPGPPFLLNISNIVLGRAAEQAGDLKLAQRAYARRPGGNLETLEFTIPMMREEARLAALNGDRQRAALLYRRYLLMHERAEPSLKPVDDAVRRDLARIAGEPQN